MKEADYIIFFCRCGRRKRRVCPPSSCSTRFRLVSELVERTLTDVASVKTPIICDVWSCFWKNLFFAQIASFGCFQSRRSLSNQLLNKLGRHTEKEEEEEIMRQMKILGGLFGRNSTAQYRTQVNFSLLQDLF